MHTRLTCAVNAFGVAPARHHRDLSAERIVTTVDAGADFAV
eukprot:CAMPEP_0119410748 /NCGR_PEP_ID=MMETSP1335-20130426/3682_1 /TAXON_ID=259385 /ORGANISM="Chrysoculter rhomboideus, Strain RCC1486" /LENGTH=40 /DNA_ID= /DNA_START= /DNA_END= /DNA_ORIENTATION=